MIELAQQIALAEEGCFPDVVVPLAVAKALLEDNRNYHLLLRSIAESGRGKECQGYSDTPLQK